MAKTAFIEALEAAKSELLEVEEQLAPLAMRKHRLETIIEALQPEAVKNEHPKRFNPFSAEEVAKSEPLWKGLRDLLSHSDPFTIGEAASAFESFMEGSLGPNRHQIVRNALVRHPETFERMLDGKYQVKGINV